jgi:beta-glucosidase
MYAGSAQVIMHSRQPNLTTVMVAIGTAPGAGRPAVVTGHHALARRAAAESAVLLKNEDAILPLDPAASMTLAVIGEFARTPKFQGGGSSQINPTQVDNALDGIRAAAGEHLRISFSPGFTLSGEED